MTTARTVTAHQAVALDMHRAGHTLTDIKAATGLTATEIAELTAGVPVRSSTPSPVQAPVLTLTTQPAVDLPADPARGPAELLTWARTHERAAIRHLAARADQALTQLAEHRTRAAIVEQAEQRVARARANLAAAEKALRAARTGGQPPEQPTTAQIRAWARTHGIDVPAYGSVPARVRQAYNTAHGAAK